MVNGFCGWALTHNFLLPRLGRFFRFVASAQFYRASERPFLFYFVVSIQTSNFFLRYSECRILFLSKNFFFNFQFSPQECRARHHQCPLQLLDWEIAREKENETETVRKSTSLYNLARWFAFMSAWSSFHQVGVINKGKTECYECQTKATPVTFPVCTIRDTPDKPIHCIAWAKLMYEVLFGPPDDDNVLVDLKVCFCSTPNGNRNVLRAWSG